MKAVFMKVMRFFGLDALLARALERLLQALIKKLTGTIERLSALLERLQTAREKELSEL